MSLAPNLNDNLPTFKNLQKKKNKKKTKKERKRKEKEKKKKKKEKKKKEKKVKILGLKFNFVFWMLWWFAMPYTEMNSNKTISAHWRLQIHSC
jgi:cytoskeletal protein RodZ